MKNVFSINSRHTVTEANINFYTFEFVHPKRRMKEHDFIYLSKGEWKFGQNDEVFNLKKDSVLILAANNLHFGITPCVPRTKTMYFHVSCEEGDMKAEADENSIAVESLTDASVNQNIKQCFLNIVNSKLSGNQMKADVYFELLLCELAENHLYTSDGAVASKIKNIIHSNPEMFFTNTELAEKTNVSVKTAENKFRSMYGTTIHQYILNFKIDEAIQIFDNFPEMSIKKVAHNLGFYDEYHFSKQFKKIKGVSPMSYIKNKNTEM